MYKYLSYLFLVLASLCMVTNCTEEPEREVDDPNEETIFVPEDSSMSYFVNGVTFSMQESHFIIEFYTNKKWEAHISYTTDVNDWISISQTEGTAGNNHIEIVLTQNNDTSNRTAILCITCGGYNEYINVEQTSATKSVIDITTPGTLGNYIGEDARPYIKELTISGKLNGTDIKLIRSLFGTSMAPQLDKLDISDATIVSGGEQYISMADGEVYTSNYTISSYMFMDFHGSELKIPENTIRIENGSFWFLSKVENLTIPRSVREIGWNTFFACSSLKELEIPVSAKPIDENLGLWISNCSDLEIFKSLSSAIKISISQCDNLRIIELHGGINDNGIKDLPSLDTVTLCDGLTEIGIMNFQNCPSLTEITIPASVTNIAGNAFLDYNIYSQEGESSLREIHYKGSNSPWSYIDKNAFKKCKLYVPKSAISNFEKVSEFFETVIGE